MILESVASKISEQTVGITVMHYTGYGSDMKKFADISKSFGLYLVEDACHGLGGSFEVEHLEPLEISHVLAFMAIKS